MHGKSDDLKTVLVVDDSGTLRNQLTGLLQKFGYETMVAENGLDGFEILEKNSGIDLVIADVVMPVMGGMEAAKLIKSLSTDRYCPIVFVTGLDDTESALECIDCGGDDVIVKPCTRDMLRIRIRALENLRLRGNRAYMIRITRVPPNNPFIILLNFTGRMYPPEKPIPAIQSKT